jgi:hypothetical protein
VVQAASLALPRRSAPSRLQRGGACGSGVGMSQGTRSI